MPCNRRSKKIVPRTPFSAKPDSESSHRDPSPGFPILLATNRLCAPIILWWDYPHQGGSALRRFDFGLEKIALGRNSANAATVDEASRASQSGSAALVHLARQLFCLVLSFWSVLVSPILSVIVEPHNSDCEQFFCHTFDKASLFFLPRSIRSHIDCVPTCFRHLGRSPGPFPVAFHSPV